METFRLLIVGFSNSLLPINILVALVGAILGLVVGALPGLGSTAGISLLLSLTFKMDPTTAIIMLAALYYGNMYGGAFSAIMLNIPGDSPAIMTALDGYPLRRSGKAGKALFTANISSFIGGLIGIAILTSLGPSLARWGLTFGPPDMALLVILALTSIGWVVGDSPSRGLLATALGAILATIGMTPSTGRYRLTFDILNLMNGISFIPLIIGVFGFSGVIDMIVNPQEKDDGMLSEKLTIRGSLLDKKERRRILPVTARSGLLGTFVGVLPGSGATMAAFFSYITEKRIGKNRNQMGKGALEGVAATESANNAASIGAFAPMLALGIPGSASTAVLMGALIMWGLTPGPLLFDNRPDFVWGLISSMYAGNLVCILVAVAVIPFVVRIVNVSNKILIPIITSICLVGAFTANMRMFDVYVMLAGGLIGYFMQISSIPTAPLLLTFVLMPLLERYISSSINISSGSVSIFFMSTISKVLVFLIVGFIVMPVLLKAIRSIKEGRKT